MYKVRRLNQVGSIALYLGGPAVLFDRACRIERQKIERPRFKRRILICDKSNAYIANRINKLVLTQSFARSE